MFQYSDIQETLIMGTLMNADLAGFFLRVSF